MSAQVTILEDLFYWLRGRRYPIRDPERTEKIRTIEYAAHTIPGERLALLEQVAQLIDDDRVMEVLLRGSPNWEDEDHHGKDYLVPRQQEVRDAVRTIRRVVARTNRAYPRSHEPSVFPPRRNGDR